MRQGRGIHEETVLGRAYDARLVRWLWQWTRPHMGLVTLSLFLFAAVSAFQLVQPYLIKVAIDRYMLPGHQTGLNHLALLFLAALAGEFVFRFMEIYVMEKTGQAVVFDLRTALFAHLQRLPASFFDRNPVGRLLTRVTTDVEALNEVFASGVVTVFGDMVKLLGIVIVMLWMDARLALTTFTVIPVMLFLSIFFRRRLRNLYRSLRQRLARINTSLNESISGMALVQLFLRQEHNYREFEELNHDHYRADTGAVLYDSLFSAMVEWIGSLSVALIIWYGSGQIVSGLITFGILVAFIEYAQKFFVPSRELSTKYTVMQSAMAASERLVGLLEEKPEQGAVQGLIHSSGARPAERGTGAGGLEFRDVHFHYHSGEEILCGVNFQIKPGETVAVVGFTGAGKSTLIKLLVRLYEPTGGQILLDGVDLRSIPPAVLRRRIGVVLQDPFLFQGSIASNISLDDPALDREQIESAAATVHAHPFISRLPGGYEFSVLPRGANLSTGQKQLLAFARALASDPELLVLDEATSSIDPITEGRIQQSLAGLTQNRTSLIIAHRLSTITSAQRILVLHEGRIVEEGHHADLLISGGLYARLHSLQSHGRLAGPARS
ncbi:MAG: ABC transporter ATP-binding protein [Acidobacteriota bacterium]